MKAKILYGLLLSSIFISIDATPTKSQVQSKIATTETSYQTQISDRNAHWLPGGHSEGDCRCGQHCSNQSIEQCRAANSKYLTTFKSNNDRKATGASLSDGTLTVTKSGDLGSSTITTNKNTGRTTVDTLNGSMTPTTTTTSKTGHTDTYVDGSGEYYTRYIDIRGM